MRISDAHLGQRVRTDGRIRLEQASGWGASFLTDPGHDAIITRLGRERVIIRQNDRSGWIGIHEIEPADTVLLDPNAPQPRKLGQMPTEGEHIAVNDPRVQWIWNDIATYADKAAWCAQYDRICADLGLPGRPRIYTVRGDLNGIPIVFNPSARSVDEVTVIVRNILGDLGDAFVLGSVT